VDTTEDDVRRVWPRCGFLGQLETVAGDIGERDDLIALVVVAEDEDLVPQSGLGDAGTFDQAGVRGSRQLTGTFDAPFGSEVTAVTEDQERKSGVTQGFQCDAHAPIVCRGALFGLRCSERYPVSRTVPRFGTPQTCRLTLPAAPLVPKLRQSP